MEPKAIGSGLADTLASLCGALPVPEIIGIIGIPELWVLGRLLTEGGQGSFSSRPLSFFPLSD